MTDANEFIRFHKLLVENAPEGYKPFYFRCAKEGKEPYTKVGSWLKNPLTPKEAVGWLKEGGNVGIAGLNEDPLVLIDIDDETITDYKTLKSTLTVRSGSRKGVHLYYFEDIIGSIPNIPTDDAGEIRANNQYVIAPGSYVAGYKGKKKNIGKYTIEAPIAAVQIAPYDIPQIFVNQIEQNKADTKTARERKAKKTGNAEESSALFDLSIYDIISAVGNPQERFPSIFHGSDTGKNTSISDKGLIQCWRHQVSLNAQQALCVLSGKLSCREAGTGHKGGGAGPSLYTDNDEALFAAWKYSKENGYIPEDDPIPTRALCYTAVNEKFCKEEDIEGGWKIPIGAYKKVLEHLKKEGINSGRKKIEHTIAKNKTDGQLHEIGYYLIFREKKDGTKEISEFKHKLFGDNLINIYHFKTLQDTEEVIYYEDGYYHYEGEAIIRTKSEIVFGESLNSYHVNEILNHIRRSTYIKRKELNNDLWTLNLENGLLNIKTFVFTPHIPDLVTTIRMPLNYDPNATCPAIEKFVSEIVYPEHVKLIKEMIGYCLYHDYTYQNWFLLHGEGANGKSKMLSLIGKFLGEENVSSIGLQDLNQRFAPVNLYGKSANVVADLSDADLKKTAKLKQLTGGDLITAEPKFKNAFTYFNFAKLIYSCNKVPLTEDKSKAFFRRVIFIPFPNTFVIGKNADEKILDKLTTKEELSGLLNVAIAGLKHIAGNGGFTGYLTPEENEELYERASNPVYGFFYDCCEINVEKHVGKMELYDAFCEYCKEMRIVAFSEKKFIQEIKLLVRLDESRISVGKQRVRVWKGIAIKDVHDVHDVQDFFIPKVSVENSSENNNISKEYLGKTNDGQGGQGGQGDNYAKCELCEKTAPLTPYNLNGKEIGICESCRKELEEKEKTGTAAQDQNIVLICVCGKKFDTQEVLQEHQAKCKEFQANQNKEAREEIKRERE